MHSMIPCCVVANELHNNLCDVSSVTLYTYSTTILCATYVLPSQLRQNDIPNVHHYVILCTILQ